jgi:endonuclease YncB( thermonuclease family)
MVLFGNCGTSGGLAKGQKLAAVVLSTTLVFLSALGSMTYPAQAETVDGRRFVIIDGDTVAYRRERIRILNIDAPESFRSRCEAELKLALRAKERLAQLLQTGAVEIERQGEDRYRRTLARLSAKGGDVGMTLVREGLALPWQDGAAAKEARLRRWCGARHWLK